jgi:hypothetical protein
MSAPSETSAVKRLTLELDCDSDPIGGRMLEEGGTSRPFVGWLGLASALGSVLVEPPPGDADAGGTEKGP